MFLATRNYRRFEYPAFRNSVLAKSRQISQDGATDHHFAVSAGYAAKR